MWNNAEEKKEDQSDACEEKTDACEDEETESEE